MTEAETIDLLATYVENAITFITVYVSFTFAYLTTAFFVGSRLTKFQVLTVSVIYVLAALSMSGAFYASMVAYETLMHSRETMFDEIGVLQAGNWTPGMMVFLSTGIGVSLFFMYDVRKKRE